MEVDPAVLAYDGTDFLYRLDDARLVVYRHHRNERGVRANRSLEFLEIQNTVLFDPEVGDIETLLLQFPARIEDALVFLFWEVIQIKQR